MRLKFVCDNYIQRHIKIVFVSDKFKKASVPKVLILHLSTQVYNIKYTA